MVIVNDDVTLLCIFIFKTSSLFTYSSELRRFTWILLLFLRKLMKG